VTALVGAELLKLRTAPRTALALVLGLLGIVALGTAGTVDSAVDSPVDVDEVLRDVVSGPAGVTAFFALVLGVLVVTTEFRHGTATHTFLAAPRRERVLAAKVTASVLAAALLALLATALALAIAIVWLTAADRSVPLADGDLVGDGARLLLGSALWAALGVAVGAVVRNQAGAIAFALIWLLVAEPLASTVFDRVADYLPGAAIAAVLGWDESGLSAGRGLAVALAYVVVLGVAATAATVRRDLT